MKLLRAAPVIVAHLGGLAALACDGSVAGPVTTRPVIVFARVLEGQRDIYRVTLDGEALSPLSTDLGDDREPTVAGENVVFASYRDGNAELYSVQLAGGAERRLTNTSANETSPALSRSGFSLAFTSDISGVTRLWTAAADGSGAGAAAPSFGPSGVIDASPAWSPAGDRVAFVSTAAGEASLYVLVIATGVVTPLPAGPPPNVEPAWSDDGRWIAFASGRSGGKGIYLLDVGSGAVTLLVPGNVGQPAWLRDGRLLYVAFSPTGSRLFWVDPTTPGTPREIDTGPGEASHPGSP
jgi:TolB protein